MPAFKHRAVMLDPARLMDRQEHYLAQLPWLKEWGYNVVHLHLTDDQGCRLVFPSHPELASSEAFTEAQMRDYIARAGKLGLEVIPEIESFGHARCITGHKSFAHLGAKGGSGFSALDPEHPDTRRVLTDLFRDTARIFPNPVIHVGLDEVNLKTLPRYAKINPEESWKIFARHAAWVHQAVRKLDKRPAMWGDHILSAKPMAAKFQRDVLIFDWHYGAQFDPGSLQFFCDQGFEVWGSPSTMCWESRVISVPANLENLRRFSARALAFRKAGVSGMVNTIWCPWRYLPGAMDWPTALAGHLFSAEREDPDFCRHFARSFYGLAAPQARDCAAAIQRLHAAALSIYVYDILVLGKLWSYTFSREEQRVGAVLAEQCGQVAGTLKKLSGKATRHAERLNDVYLSARVLQRVGQFAAAGRDKSALPNGKPLLEACVKSWQRQRGEPWQFAETHFPSGEKLLPTLAGLV